MIRISLLSVFLTAALAVPAGAQSAATPPPDAPVTAAAPTIVVSPEEAARAASRAGRWADALILWKTLSDARPNDPNVTAEFGWAQMEAGDADDARRTFNRALRLDPANARAVAGRVALAIRALNPAEAVRIAEGAVKTSPDSAAAWRTLGDARRAASLRSEAEDAYRRAVQLDPNDAASHAGLAAALLTRNKASEALREYRAAARLEQGAGTYDEGMARAAMAAGQYGAAALGYARAMERSLASGHADWQSLDALAQSAMDALGRASTGLRDGSASREDVTEANTTILRVTDAIAALPEIENADITTNPAMAQRALAYDLMGQAAASDLAALRKGTTSEASDAFVFREQARRALISARAAGAPSP